MSRLPILLLAASLLPGCECHVDYGLPIDTREIAKEAMAMMATEGVPLGNVECGESFFYRKDHHTLVCKGTVDDLKVDVPIEFHDSQHFNVRPELPGVASITSEKLVAYVAETYGKDVSIHCPSELVFWTGHDTQKCTLTVEGQTDDAIMRMKGGQAHLEPDRDKVLDAGWMERQLVQDLRELAKLESKVDCGKPRLLLRRPGRRLDCRWAADGSEGHVLAEPLPTGVGFVIIESAGLRHEAVEAILGKLSVTPAGATWSCPVDLQIVRGQPFHCDVVEAGGVRKSIEITVNEDRGTYGLRPRP
jgi:hypothetical protein